MFPCQLPAHKADDKTEGAAGCGCFSGSDNTRKEGVHDDGKKNEYVDDVRECFEPLPPRAFVAGGSPIRMAPADVAYGRCNKNGKYGAWYYVAKKEFTDGLAGIQSVYDEHDARRDQNAEGGPGRDRTGVKHGMIAIFSHGRDRHLAHGCGCGSIAPADG